jgi:signal transduction histidine kinase
MSESPLTRILVVDHEAPQMKALCDTLGRQGYAPTGFTSVEKALAALRDQPCDLLLTDLTMPEIDGIAFLRAARQIDPNVVGVVMTGHGTIGSAVEAMKAGALDYILKPFKLSAVLPVLARALTVRRLRLENTQLRESLAMSELRHKNFELEEQARRVQEADRLKSEFLAMMSHELRTPLNGIIGFSEFILDEKPGPLNPKQREYMSDVLTSGRHLLELINDILDLSKVEAGKMELHPEPLRLAKVIEEVCAIINPMAMKKNINVTTTLDKRLDRLTLDSQKLKQVLYNLLSNAVKFTPEGGKIEITAKPSGENEFLLLVRDSGAGIRPEDLGKLFMAFQQLHSAGARPHDGTGLGLALTKKIVELQGGTLKVESELGRGSLFAVTLPVTMPQGKA